LELARSVPGLRGLAVEFRACAWRVVGAGRFSSLLRRYFWRLVRSCGALTFTRSGVNVKQNVKRSFSAS